MIDRQFKEVRSSNDIVATDKTVVQSAAFLWTVRTSLDWPFMLLSLCKTMLPLVCTIDLQTEVHKVRWMDPVKTFLQHYNIEGKAFLYAIVVGNETEVNSWTKFTVTEFWDFSRWSFWTTAATYLWTSIWNKCHFLIRNYLSSWQEQQRNCSKNLNGSCQNNRQLEIDIDWLAFVHQDDSMVGDEAVPQYRWVENQCELRR